MKEINFITSNKGKVESLKRACEKNNLNVKVVANNLEIMELQVDTVAEVSKYKALAAYNILRAPVLVEDGGCCIDALNGFPGVYTKYVLSTIGVDGLINLMKDKANRTAHFASVTTYVDENGTVTQFVRQGGGFTLALSKTGIINPNAWSELWQVIYFDEYQKTLSELSPEELNDFYNKTGATGSLQQFVEWYVKNI